MFQFNIVKRILIWFIFTLILFSTLVVLIADVNKTKDLILSINPKWFLPIILAVLFNYCLRFLKWQFFLKLLDIKISLKDSLWMFFAAFTMVLSPGKLGEVIKSLFLKSRYGIPISKSAPIVMAERVTDLFGLFILSAIGCSYFAYGTKTLVSIGLILVVCITLITRKAFWRFCDSHLLSRFSFLVRFKESFRALEESTSNLLSVSSLILTVPLSAISWAGEGVALYFIFKALQVDQKALLGISLFAHAFSSILGAFSFLPGGLLVTEGALSMFFIYVGITKEQSVSATFLIRVLTLWFAVILGAIVFLLGRRPGDLSGEQLEHSEG